MSNQYQNLPPGNNPYGNNQYTNNNFGNQNYPNNNFGNNNYGNNNFNNLSPQIPYQNTQPEHFETFEDEGFKSFDLKGRTNKIKMSD
jgi:hypothetical protein